MSGFAFIISLVVFVQCVQSATNEQLEPRGPDVAQSRIARLKNAFLAANEQVTCQAEGAQCYGQGSSYCPSGTANSGKIGCCGGTTSGCCSGLVCGGTSADNQYWAGCRQPSEVTNSAVSFCGGAPSSSTAAKSPSSSPKSSSPLASSSSPKSSSATKSSSPIAIASSSSTPKSSSGVAGTSSVGGSRPRFKGVNLSGGEFGCSPTGCSTTTSDANTLKGYYFPTTSGGDVDYFASLGMNIIRLPFAWERLIYSSSGFPAPGTAMSSTYLGQIDTIVNYATGTKGIWVLLDVHNYATYNSVVINTAASISSFADLWSQLATHYKGNSKVVFGLMNEPHQIDTALWFKAAQAAITAIRATGATNLINVPGNGYTGGHSYTTGGYDDASAAPNSVVLTQTPLTDSANNYVLDIHEYLDSDYSGTGTCVSPPNGASALAAVTSWASSAGHKLFLTEVGGDNSAACQAAVQNIIGYINNNTNVWIGFTWWVAGSAYIEWNSAGQEYLIEKGGTQASGILSYLQPLITSTTGTF